MWIREQIWGDSDPKLTPFDSDSLSDLDFFKKHGKKQQAANFDASQNVSS